MISHGTVLHHFMKTAIFTCCSWNRTSLTSSKNFVTSKTLLWITNQDDPATLCDLTSSKVIFFNPSAIFLTNERNRLLELKVTHAWSLASRLFSGALYGSAGSQNDALTSNWFRTDRKWRYMIPTKDKEWQGYISGEGETIYKTHKLKSMFYHFTRNIPLLRTGIDGFHCHAIKIEKRIITISRKPPCVKRNRDVKKYKEIRHFFKF